LSAVGGGVDVGKVVDTRFQLAIIIITRSYYVTLLAQDGVRNTKRSISGVAFDRAMTQQWSLLWP